MSGRDTDLYRNYAIRLGFTTAPDVAVAGFTAILGLAPARDPTPGRKLPDRDKFEPITLERGVTQDASFVNWLTATRVSVQSARRDILITVLNESGQPRDRYTVLSGWVSEYQGLPDLDRGANAVAIQHIKIENEGWERDNSVREPG